MKKNICAIIAVTASLFVGCVDNGETPDIKKGTSPVKINEVYSRGGGSVDPGLDWVELYNTSGQTADIGGFVLSDKLDKSEKITFPANTTIAGNSFLKVEVDTPEGFGLSSGGDMVYLYNAAGAQIDYVEFGAMEETMSWSAYPDGSGTFAFRAPSPGAANNESGVVAPPPADYTGLVINEVDGNGKFVELYNAGEATISLAGVKLIKNETSLWWTSGQQAEIEAGGYYTICEQGGDLAAQVDEATGDGGISPKKNIKFELKEPDDTLIDAFVRSVLIALDANCTPDYGKTTPPYSFARCPDGTGEFGLAEPSVDDANPATSAGTIETDTDARKK